MAEATPKKNTRELLQELQGTEEFRQFYAKNEQEFISDTIPEDLAAMLEQKGLRKADVIRTAEMSDAYAYQIFNGIRRPDRNKLLMILIAIGATFEETQTFLKRHGFGQLYAKNEFDCAVIYGICRKYSVPEINFLLYELGLPMLE